MIIPTAVFLRHFFLVIVAIAATLRGVSTSKRDCIA